jgi:hypothetical protein
MLIPLPGGAFGRWSWMAEEYDTETMTGNMANPVRRSLPFSPEHGHLCEPVEFHRSSGRA